MIKGNQLHVSDLKKKKRKKRIGTRILRKDGFENLLITSATFDIYKL